MTVTVYGTGCPKCQKVEQAAKDAVAELGLEVVVDHVRDPLEIAKANVMFTPALAVNGAIKCTGKVPTVAEVKGWLQA